MGNPGNGIGNTGVSVGAIGIAGSDILSVMPLMRISRKGILLEREKSTIDWSVSDQFLLVSNSLEASMKATLALTEGVRVSTEASALSRAFLSGLFMTKGSFSSYLSGGTEGSFPESSESGGIGPSLRWRLGASVTALREDSLFNGVDIGSDQFGTLIPEEPGTRVGPFCDLRIVRFVGPLPLIASLGLEMDAVSGLASGMTSISAVGPLPGADPGGGIAIVSFRAGLFDDIGEWGVLLMLGVESWRLILASSGLDVNPNRADPALMVILTHRI